MPWITHYLVVVDGNSTCSREVVRGPRWDILCSNFMIKSNTIDDLLRDVKENKAFDSESI